MGRMCSLIRAPPGRARTRNGSIPCASRGPSSGARRRIRTSSSRSMPGRATLSLPEDLAAVAAAVAPIPRGEDGAPVFAAPWEAQAFAMTLALHERGVFTWTEWGAALAAEIKRAQSAGDPDDGSTYYRHWLAAIERLVAVKGVATPATL